MVHPLFYAEFLDELAADPLALHAYPLRFLASLFTADLSGMIHGSIRCPVVVRAATGDPPRGGKFRPSRRSTRVLLRRLAGRRRHPGAHLEVGGQRPRRRRPCP